MNGLRNRETLFANEKDRWRLAGKEITSECYLKKIKATLEEMEGIKVGAYAPLPEDVALLAALIPSGGYGLLAVLQRLFLQ